MRASKYFFKTYKEIPKEAQTPSHILMHRAGMIQKLASGIYNYLPLALRTLKKIEKIIREELDKRECQEVLMPAVQPAELWEESGRWKYYGHELLRFKDRKNSDYCFGPTHEEVITDMARKILTSYKQLPLNLYQIQTKFRDEIRPRFGLMRGREFIMKDAYSFDINEEDAKKSYKLMYEAYNAIFERINLKFKPVDAATGAIGGDMSHEFQVLAETGEDEILSCSKCSYCANIEKAVSGNEIKKADASKKKELKEVSTPNIKTIEELSAFFKLDPARFIKTIIYLVDEKPVVALLRGNEEANEAKIQAFLGANSITPANDALIKSITGAEVGFAGPVKLAVTIIADKHIYEDTDYICGANKTDYHFTGFDPERDFATWTLQAAPRQDVANGCGISTHIAAGASSRHPCRDAERDVHVADITFAKEGDKCSKCDTGILEKYRGIEVGQVFYLGTKYSSLMNCVFLDKDGKEQVAVMGCYGIGVSRTMAAAIEQNHDDNGIIWPAAIAPFEAAVIPVQTNNELVVETSEKIYKNLLAAGIDAFMDDRNERAGFKFNDADLIGFPVQIICGKLVESGKVEVKIRKTGEKKEIDIENIAAAVKELLLSL
ncbi:MAG: proline--tRNA ligase [Spirochaetes bacterium]|nr:proline--tRNA ligase [Spirochaetota bacterium]